MQITSEAIQRWIRVGLYAIFGGLANYGINVSNSWRDIAISVVGFIATIVWTKYGSTVAAMLSEVEKTAGVNKVDVKVDPNVIDPHKLAESTPPGVAVKPS